MDRRTFVTSVIAAPVAIAVGLPVMAEPVTNPYLGKPFYAVTYTRFMADQAGNHFLYNIMRDAVQINQYGDMWELIIPHDHGPMQRVERGAFASVNLPRSTINSAHHIVDMETGEVYRDFSNQFLMPQFDAGMYYAPYIPASLS